MNFPKDFRRSVGLATLGLLAFAVTTAGVRLWAGSAAARQDDSLAAKLAHFEAHKDSYTSVFIGNSRIYRSLNPAIFDKMMTDAGRNSHSYNFGIPAMTEAEINKVVRQITAADPCCLKYVFVELWSPSHLVSVRADRTVASYDPLTAWFALQHTIGSDRELDKKALMSAEIVAAAGLNSANVGSLRHKLPSDISENTQSGEDIDFYNGYTPLEQETLPEILERREAFVAEGEEAFLSLVEEQKEAYGNRPGLSAYQKRAIRVLNGYVNRLEDADLIHIVSPFGESYRVDNDTTRVFDYNDVTTYKDLYEMSLWFDEGHVGAEGAELITRDLVEKVLEMEKVSVPVAK